MLLPGRNAPVIVCDHSIQVPEIFPGLVLFPQEDLPFDEAAVPVDARDGGHIRGGQRRADHALEIRQVVARIDGERDGRGAALHGPLDADHRRVHAEAPGDGDDHRVFDIDGVVGRAVALRASGRTDGAVGDGLDSVGAHELEQFGLLQVRVHLHFVDGGLDARVGEQQFELGDGHVAGADVAHQAEVHQFLHLPPRLHEVLVDVGAGVGTARTDVAPRRMEIGERPVDQVHVQVVELQVGERLAEGRDDVGFGVLVVPELAGDPQLLARDAARDDLLQNEANSIFVAIDAGAIEVAVAHGGGALDGRGDFVRGDVVAAEGAESDGRHAGAGVESSLGDEGGVDGSCVHENGTNVYVSWKMRKMLRLYRLLWEGGGTGERRTAPGGLSHPGD